MAGYRRPPVRALKFITGLLGATAMGSTGREHWGRSGLAGGILLGFFVGWLVAWWVARELFGD